MDKLIVRLLENQAVISAITLLITTACGLGVAYLAQKREQLIELSIVSEYFDNLQGNHYIHGLDEKLESLYEKEKQRGKRRNS